MIEKWITWLTVVLIVILGIPVVILLALISLLWTAAGKITGWIEAHKA